MKTLLTILLFAAALGAQELFSTHVSDYPSAHVYDAALYLCADKANYCDGNPNSFAAFLLPDKERRGTLDRDVKPSYRHWVIELPRGMTIRQAFALMDDLGCGPKPEWTLEHLVHAIERQSHYDGGSWKLPRDAPAVLVHR